MGEYACVQDFLPTIAVVRVLANQAVDSSLRKISSTGTFIITITTVYVQSGYEPRNAALRYATN